MARVVIRSPYDCQFDGEESVSPSRQGLAPRHLLIAANACQPELRTFLFQYHNSQWSDDYERIGVVQKDRRAKVSPRSSSSLGSYLFSSGLKLHTLDFNESAYERGGASVSIVIKLLLDGSVVVCLAKGASVRGVVLT